MLEALRSRFFGSNDTGNIARRYIVLNGFDGILTVLGITVGAWVAQVGDPRPLISAGLGTAVGLLISGISGAYITERAERLRDFKELRSAMLSKMEGSVQEQEVRDSSIFIALLNGASPFFCSIVSIVPYFLAHYGFIPLVNIGYYLSMAISGLLLALFGGFLGRISKESMAKYAFKMLAVGAVTVIVMYVLGLGGR